MKINVTEPDFNAIRSSIKEFLSSQTEFRDYDFEGSGMAQLIDILAYNTCYKAFYTNKVGNEMFLDSAVIRENVVSRAKMLNYRPRSVRGAKAYIDITVNPGDAPDQILVERGTKFSSIIDSVTYTFSTLTSFVIEPVDGAYIAENVEITEGEVLRYEFTVNDLDETQRFVLPNKNVDTSTIRVTVQDSISNTTTYVYNVSTNIITIDENSRVYFIQEIEGGKTEIYFGDGVIGRKPAHGNIVIVEYLSSNGEDANGLSSFTPQAGIGGYNSYNIETVSPSSSGAIAESIESIKLLAPMWYQSQGRAVNAVDYETLVKSDYPNIDSVRVWGGEENDPPYYGKVFICIKPLDSTSLSSQVKDKITKNLIRNRNMVSIQVEIVDPDYVYIVVSTLIKWRSDLTEDTQGEVQNAVKSAIVSYGETELDNFDTYFRYSKFIQTIDQSHSSIKNSLTTIQLKYKLVPSLTITQNYIINFSNAIDPNVVSNSPTLSSTAFILDGFTCYLDDQDGIVRAYRLLEGARVDVRTNLGTIDYVTGKIQINRFLPTAFTGEFMEITVRPLELDVITTRNQLLLIEGVDVKVDMKDEIQ